MKQETKSLLKTALIAIVLMGVVFLAIYMNSQPHKHDHSHESGVAHSH